MRNLIQSIREEKGLRQRDLSHLADVDMSHLSKIENDRTDPTLTTAKRIADALGLRIDRVFVGLTD